MTTKFFSAYTINCKLYVKYLLLHLTSPPAKFQHFCPTEHWYAQMHKHIHVASGVCVCVCTCESVCMSLCGRGDGKRANRKSCHRQGSWYVTYLGRGAFLDISPQKGANRFGMRKFPHSCANYYNFLKLNFRYPYCLLQLVLILKHHMTFIMQNISPDPCPHPTYHDIMLPHGLELRNNLGVTSFRQAPKWWGFFGRSSDQCIDFLVFRSFLFFCFKSLARSLVFIYVFIFSL